MFKIQTGNITPLCVMLPCSARCIRGALEHEHRLLLWGQSACWTLNQNDSYEGQSTFLPHPLYRSYCAMCYDHAEKCFWAVAASQPDILYKLNEHFEECSYIRIHTTYSHPVTGICCDESGRGIWLVYPARIGFFSKESCEIEWQMGTDRKQSYYGILMHCGYQIIAVSTPCGLVIRVVSLHDEQVAEMPVPQEYSLLAILPEHAHDGSCCFSLLLRELYTGTLAVMDCCIRSECCCMTVPDCDDTECCSHEECHEPHCLCPSCCPCPPPCPCPCPCPCPPPCPSPCPCPPPCPSPCPCPPYCPDRHGCYEILHSIALEEAALAHILNAEGEKLQKAVALDSSVEQLLCVNESIKQTITQVSILEGQLYSKLESIVTRCKDFCFDQKHCSCICDEQNQNAHC